MLSDSQIRVSIGGDTCFITQSGLDKGNADKKNVKRRSRIPKKPRNPQPKEWLSSELSQNYIADYKPFNFVDLDAITRLHKIFITANPILKSLKIR